MCVWLPQAPIPEETESRETESGRGDWALRFPVSGSYHISEVVEVLNQETSRFLELEGQSRGSEKSSPAPLPIYREWWCTVQETAIIFQKSYRE